MATNQANRQRLFRRQLEQNRVSYRASGSTAPWPEAHRDTFENIQRLGSLRFRHFSDSIVRDSSNQPWREETKQRAQLLVHHTRKLIVSYGINESTWRSIIENLILARFEKKNACPKCNGRIWRSEIEASISRPEDVARILEDQRRQHTECKCSKPPSLDRLANKLFEYVLEESVFDDDLPEIKKKPDRVYGLALTQRLADALNRLNPRSRLFHSVARRPFKTHPFRPQLRSPFFPFLVLEAKSSSSNHTFDDIRDQTAYPIRALLRVQENLQKQSLEISHGDGPLVWFLGFHGEHWKVYGCYLTDQKPPRYEIAELWRGQISNDDDALQLLLIIDYIVDWATDVYEPSIIRQLDSLEVVATSTRARSTNRGGVRSSVARSLSSRFETLEELEYQAVLDGIRTRSPSSIRSIGARSRQDGSQQWRQKKDQPSKRKRSRSPVRERNRPRRRRRSRSPRRERGRSPRNTRNGSPSQYRDRSPMRGRDQPQTTQSQPRHERDRPVLRRETVQEPVIVPPPAPPARRENNTTQAKPVSDQSPRRQQGQPPVIAPPPQLKRDTVQTQPRPEKDQPSRQESNQQPVRPAPVQPVPAHPAPVRSIPAHPAPVRSTPAHPTPVRPAPTNSDPVRSTPAHPAPARSTPVRPAPEHRAASTYHLPGSRLGSICSASYVDSRIDGLFITEHNVEEILKQIAGTTNRTREAAQNLLDYLTLWDELLILSWDDLNDIEKSWTGKVRPESPSSSPVKLSKFLVMLEFSSFMKDSWEIVRQLSYVAISRSAFDILKNIANFRGHVGIESFDDSSCLRPCGTHTLMQTVQCLHSGSPSQLFTAAVSCTKVTLFALPIQRRHPGIHGAPTTMLGLAYVQRSRLDGLVGLLHRYDQTSKTLTVPFLRISEQRDCISQTDHHRKMSCGRCRQLDYPEETLNQFQWDDQDIFANSDGFALVEAMLAPSCTLPPGDHALCVFTPQKFVGNINPLAVLTERQRRGSIYHTVRHPVPLRPLRDGLDTFDDCCDIAWNLPMPLRPWTSIQQDAISDWIKILRDGQEVITLYDVEDLEQSWSNLQMQHYLLKRCPTYEDAQAMAEAIKAEQQATGERDWQMIIFYEQRQLQSSTTWVMEPPNVRKGGKLRTRMYDPKERWLQARLQIAHEPLLRTNTFNFE